MTSNRKQLHLQDGTDAKLDVVVSADDGASITYDGGSNPKPMTFTASSFKFKQEGQPEINLVEKLDQVETSVTGNLEANNLDITALGGRITTANSSLTTANSDLVGKNTAANNKFLANKALITTETTNRGTALSELEKKFSKDDPVQGETAGLLHTLNAEMEDERDRIEKETKIGTDDDGDKGDRQTAIDSAKSLADTDINAEKARITIVNTQLTNLFSSFPAERLRNLAALITAYEEADSSLTNTLASSAATLTRLENVMEATFPVGTQSQG